MVTGRKSPVLAAILGFFFGAFGLFYISASQGITALVVLFVVGCGSGGAMAPLIWLGCAVWGYVAAEAHNQAFEQAGAASLGSQVPGAHPFEPPPAEGEPAVGGDPGSSNPFV